MRRGLAMAAQHNRVEFTIQDLTPFFGGVIKCIRMPDFISVTGSYQVLVPIWLGFKRFQEILFALARILHEGGND